MQSYITIGLPLSLVMESQDPRREGRVFKNRYNTVSRRKWLKATAVSGTSLLAGCSSIQGDGEGPSNGDGSDGSDGETITIDYWRWPAATDPSNEAEEALVNEFNEGVGQEKGIEVKMNTIPFGNYMQKLKSAIGADDAPEVAWSFPLQMVSPFGKSKEEIQNEAPFVYLDDLMDDEFEDHVMSSAWDWQRTRFKGLMGVPFVSLFWPGLLYLNKTAWDNAGLGDLPSSNWTLEEYHQAVQAIHGAEVDGNSVNGLGVGFKDLVSNEAWPLAILPTSRFAGSIIDEGYLTTEDKYALTLAESTYIEGYNGIYGIPIQEGWTTDPLAYEDTELIEQFVNGQIGLLINPTYTRTQIAKEAEFEWTTVPFPTKNGNDYWFKEFSGQSVMFHAFKEETGGNPEATWEFLKFRNSPESHYKYFNQSAQAVPSKGAYEMMQNEGVSDFVKEAEAMAVMDAIVEADERRVELRNARQDRYPDIKTNEVAGQTTVEKGVPKDVSGGAVHEAIGQLMQRMSIGEIEPKEAFTRAEEEWASILQDTEENDVDESTIGFDEPEPRPGPL